MKKKTIFGLTLAFAMSALFSVAVFAGSVYNSTVQKSVKVALADGTESYDRLGKDPLFFLSGHEVSYEVSPYVEGLPIPYYICKVDYKNVNKEEAKQRLASKAGQGHVTACDLFEILSYYIYKGDNERLDNFHNTFDLVMSVDNEEKYINLFHIAFYAKNKEALDIIYNKIEQREGKDAADVRLTSMVSNLLPPMTKEDQANEKKYHKEVLDQIITIPESSQYHTLVNLNVDHIIKGESYKANGIYWLVLNNTKFNNSKFLIDVLKSVIDQSSY